MPFLVFNYFYFGHEFVRAFNLSPLTQKTLKMKTNDEKEQDKNKSGESTTDKERNPAKEIKKNYLELKTEERASLKQLSTRKFIAPKALKQIKALLLLDANNTKTIVKEEVGLSAQTLEKWLTEFEKDRMDSLIVIQERKKKKNSTDSDSSEEEE